jgi:hypothetical protein
MKNKTPIFAIDFPFVSKKTKSQFWYFIKKISKFEPPPPLLHPPVQKP